MGDRALVIIKNQDRHSPVVYAHWSGGEIPEYLKQLFERMRGREGDVDYTAARLVGLLHEDIDGNLSLGIFNSPENLEEVKEPDYSHGDTGVWIVDVTERGRWVIEVWNGDGLLHRLEETMHVDPPFPYPIETPVVTASLTDKGFTLLKYLGEDPVTLESVKGEAS